jgi:hypothetical protein
MMQDALHDVGRIDQRDQAHGLAAPRAREHIDPEQDSDAEIAVRMDVSGHRRAVLQDQHDPAADDCLGEAGHVHWRPCRRLHRAGDLGETSWRATPPWRVQRCSGTSTSWWTR